MSWDVTLQVPGVEWASTDWNYTHNTNPMIVEAMERAGIEFEFVPGSNRHRSRVERVEAGHLCFRRGPDHQPGDELVPVQCSLDPSCCDLGWGDVFDGRTGPDGCRILEAVVEQWDADPQHFIAMDPPNGWGSLLPKGDGCGLRAVFVDMIEHARTEAPLVWTYSG